MDGLESSPPKASLLIWLAALLLWALALFSAWRVPKSSWPTALAALIAALLTLPRLLSLENAPYHVTLDEAIHPLYGLEMLRQRPWDIAAGTSWYFDTPFLTQALQAWPCLVFEPLFGARLASLILGLASLVSTYALAGRMFGNRTAVVAVTVLACSYSHMAYSRMAYPYMEAILMLPLVLHVLLFGVAERNRFLQFIAGVLLAASLLVYTPARVVIPILILWLAHRLLVRGVRIGEAAADAAVIALGAAIFLIPYLHAQGAGEFWPVTRRRRWGHRALCIC